MLDYRGLQALFTVIQLQSFEAAAGALHLTQSAISQRIKSLEEYYGEPVMVRSLPYRPSKLGERLLSHYKQTLLLEENLMAQLSDEIALPQISIAINRDSLETWFKKVLDKSKVLTNMTLEIISDDQEVTLNYLKQGLVAACLSTAEKSLTGCKAEFLGVMNYVLVASPAFKQQYFNNKKHKQNLLNAPNVNFDSKDKLHSRYLKRFFNIGEPVKAQHVIPSVAGFKQFTLLGYGYALVPEIDIFAELKSGKLINLFPNKVWDMPLYWHSWAIETKAYKVFNEMVIREAKKLLDR